MGKSFGVVFLGALIALAIKPTVYSMLGLNASAINASSCTTVRADPDAGGSLMVKQVAIVAAAVLAACVVGKYLGLVA